jgi:hypothetical protein
MNSLPPWNVSKIYAGDRDMENREPKSDKLDEAVEKTFPASDPVSVGSPTGTEPPKRPVDRLPPVTTKEEIAAAQRGEGHAHRDLQGSAVDEHARHEKHHGHGDAGLKPGDKAAKTRVDDHAGLGRGGKKD